MMVSLVPRVRGVSPVTLVLPVNLEDPETMETTDHL
jgi:hypothetical protein